MFIAIIELLLPDFEGGVGLLLLCVKFGIGCAVCSPPCVLTSERVWPRVGSGREAGQLDFVVTHVGAILQPMWNM